jgi:hypothetical protein
MSLLLQVQAAEKQHTSHICHYKKPASNWVHGCIARQGKDNAFKLQHLQSTVRITICSLLATGDRKYICEALNNAINLFTIQ